MTADKYSMHRNLFFAAAFLTVSGLWGQTPQIIVLSGNESQEFTVGRSDLYALTVMEPLMPLPELGVWKTDGTNRILAGRNRDAAGYLSPRWELSLEAGTRYILQETSPGQGSKVRLAPASWSELKTGIRTELNPVSRDLGELTWTGTYRLPLPPRQAELSGPQGELLAVSDSQGLTLYRKNLEGFQPLGAALSQASWDSWAVGTSRGVPLVLYSFPAAGPLKAEVKLDIWSQNLRQSGQPLPRDSAGPLGTAVWKNEAYAGFWNISGVPEWKLLQIQGNTVHSGPPLEGPASSQFHLASREEGLWAVFQTSQGTDRWYQIFRFDGKLWTNLDFPVVKNPRIFLAAEGQEEIAGVVDSLGNLSLLEKKEAFWSTIPAPDAWKHNPRSTCYLVSTSAGLTLFVQEGGGFSYRRYKEGTWTAVAAHPGRILDAGVNAGKEGYLLLQRPGSENQLDFYRFP